MRRFYWFLLLNALKAAAAHAVDPNAITFRAEVQPLLHTYCFKCHGGEKVKGDVSLAPFNDDGAVQSDPKLWGMRSRQRISRGWFLSNPTVRNPNGRLRARISSGLRGARFVDRSSLAKSSDISISLIRPTSAALRSTRH